jgi:hypothetical protein
LLSLNGDVTSNTSEFYYGYHIYKTDIDLPELDTIAPYKIELAYHGLDLTNEVYYVLDDKDIVIEIIDIIRNKRDVSLDYIQEDILSIEELNKKTYDICLFDERVPGSTYALQVAEGEDGKVYYHDKAKVKKEDLFDITYIIYLIIENGEKVFE